jgi:hypothetical protein
MAVGVPVALRNESVIDAEFGDFRSHDPAGLSHRLLRRHWRRRGDMDRGG